MNIIGKGKRGVIDSDLLGRLAVASQSGGTVSKKEAQTEIKKTVREMKDAFDCETSTRGLTKRQDAVKNTLELAIKKGFVTSGAAQSVINEFLTGSDDGSLKDTVKDIKADVREYADNYGYSGGGSSSGSTGGGGGVSYGGGGGGSSSWGT